MWLKLIFNSMDIDDKRDATHTTNKSKAWSVRGNIRHRQLYSYGFLFSIVVILLWGSSLWSLPLYAAMRLNYFDVLVNAEQITLEWSTASENELFSFEVECKKEEEPNSQYHLIGQRLAQGNKDHGAIYRLDIVDGLEENTNYCFRLREIPLNHEQGEIIDRCGYGLNITPTPDITPTPEITPTETVELTSTTTISFTPTISLVITPTVEVTATVEQPLFLTETPLPAETATSTASIDGQSLPGQVTPTDTDTPLSPTATATAIAESPLVPPTPTAGTPTDTNQSSAAALDAQTAFTSNAVVATDIVSVTTSISPTEVINTAVVVANPPYIVLTVTPTDEALAIASTFTPFPTVAIDTEPNLIAATLPSTQNMMILLLCGVFSGASGLGILGLVTTLLYMRSRAEEQQPTRKQ